MEKLSIGELFISCKYSVKSPKKSIVLANISQAQRAYSCAYVIARWLSAGYKVVV